MNLSTIYPTFCAVDRSDRGRGKILKGGAPAIRQHDDDQAIAQHEEINLNYSIKP